MEIKINRILYVRDCQNCPFVYFDEFWGYINCDAMDREDFKNSMKAGEVHKDCPLKNCDHIVKLEDTSDNSI